MMSCSAAVRMAWRYNLHRAICSASGYSEVRARLSRHEGLHVDWRQDPLHVPNTNKLQTSAGW